MGLLHYILLFFILIFFFAGLAVVLFSIGYHIYAVFNPGKSTGISSREYGYWHWDEDSY